MTFQSYNKAVSKERLDAYKIAYSHVNLLKTDDSASQARAGSHFSYPIPDNPTGNFYIPHNSTLKTGNSSQYHTHDAIKGNALFDMQKETDDFIEQAVFEWATWLAQTELKSAQLQHTSNREKNRYRVFQQQYKEALDDLWKLT
jgi:hypothetical protein